MEIHAETRCCTKLEICAEDMQHVIPVMGDHQLVDKVRWAQLWENRRCGVGVLGRGLLHIGITGRIFELHCIPHFSAMYAVDEGRVRV